MTVVDTTKDVENLTITITSELAAPPERVWQVWADARRLEQWWGPPTWPATFVEHDLVPGGHASYYMTGPDGEKAHGWWRIVAVDEPRSLEFEDGFADDSGAPDPSLPVTRATVQLVASDTGTRMTVTSRVESSADLEKLLEMGVLEGMSS